jgi:hypothetical protein
VGVAESDANPHSPVARNTGRSDADRGIEIGDEDPGGRRIPEPDMSETRPRFEYVEEEDFILGQVRVGEIAAVHASHRSYIAKGVVKGRGPLTNRFRHRFLRGRISF